MSKQTALPWIVCTMSDNDTVLSIEQDRRALVNEEPSIVAEVYLSGDGIGRETGKANAEFIVRAVNCHDELLAALEHMARVFNAKEIDPLIAFTTIEMAEAAIVRARAQS